MAIGLDWRDRDRWLNLETMRKVLMDNGMTVQTEDRRNAIGKNEVHFWLHKNGRTLHRILYEYDLGGVEQIQEHRRYFLDEIIKAFENAEKNDAARVNFMGICEMLAKLKDRGFEAKSDYDPGKKVYIIHAHKGDWHCVREVEWCDVLVNDQATIAIQTRRRQETLDGIFEAYKEYETKTALNSLYGVRINKTVPEPKKIYVTTAGCGPDTIFEKMIKERIKEKEMNNNIDWKVTNVKLNREFSPGSHDYFDVELEGIIKGPVAGNIIDISNRIQEKLNEPDGYTRVRLTCQRPSSNKLPEIKKVIFNNPATIVIWADDTKTIVKAQNDELFDPEKGLAMAITKKALGNEGRYFDTIKKWIKDEPVLKEISNEEYMLANIKSDCILAINTLKAARLNSKVTKAKMTAYVDDTIRLLQESIGYLGEEISENEN